MGCLPCKSLYYPNKKTGSDDKIDSKCPDPASHNQSPNNKYEIEVDYSINEKIKDANNMLKNAIERDNNLNKRENNLNYREDNLNKREEILNKKENEMNNRENNIDNKKNDFIENNNDIFNKDIHVINKSENQKFPEKESLIDSIKCKDNKNVLVGILGNKNRGKSFLLGRIIGKTNFMNKSGFLITTHGISANFPVLDGNDKLNIITLDTAGKDNPLLDSANINSSNSEKAHNEKIKSIARDQRVSEIVLSDFIIQESDVLITVLEQLSFAEQEMLKNLINQLKSKKVENNTVRPKKLLVIHNLMNFTDVETINNFVKNTLLNSLTFDLRKGKQPMSNFKGGDDKKYIYVQKVDELDKLDKLQIIHIIRK